MSEKRDYVGEFNRWIGRLYAIRYELELLKVSKDTLEHFDKSIWLIEDEFLLNRKIYSKGELPKCQ